MESFTASSAAEEFFDALREAAPSGIWARGIQLARDGTVAVISEADDEVELELRRGRDAFEITLYLEDDEWDCSCVGGGDVCNHIVAAVIAWRGAAQRGEALAEREVFDGTVQYQLRRVDQSLFLIRLLVFPDGREVQLDMPIARYVSRGSQEGPIVTTADDHGLEKALGERWGGRIGREIAPRVLNALLRIRDLRLDDEPVRASLAAVPPIAVVSDHPSGGFELRLEQDPAIDEVFRCGWVRCDDVIRPMTDGGVGRREMLELRNGRHFRQDKISELVGELLPRLKKGGLPVAVRTRLLPSLDRSEMPRLIVETEETLDSRLRVTGSIVYGDPIVARVVDGQLIVVGNRVPVRDWAEENRLASELRRKLGLRMGESAVAADEAAVELAERLRANADVEMVGDAIERFRLAAPIAPELAFDDEGRFSVAFRGPHGAADPGQVMRAWRSGRSLAPLTDGGYAPLPADWLQRFGHELADLLAARDARERLAPAALPAALRLLEELEQPAPQALTDRVATLRAALEDPLDGEDGELPGDFTATLRPYQSAGVTWLRRLGRAGLGALLADDMGLGKTVQTLAVIPSEPGRRSLVVAPTSVLANWRAEAARFRPELQTIIYHGSKRELDPDVSLTLTSYALLRIDAQQLHAVEWDLVVLDEAQAIKNADSQVARAAHKLSAARRVALTGTPVENRLDELWSQFHFLNPGLLGERKDFDERYAKPLAAGDVETVSRLRRRIAPFLLRRLKRDVAPELPPRSEEILQVGLSERERAVYDAIAAATRKDVVERLRGGGNVMRALEALLRLRQACCDTALIPGQSGEHRSSKVDIVVRRLAIAASSGHRALIFSQWTSLLDRMEPALEDVGLNFVRLDGSTRDRGGVVAAFQAEDGPPVMLLSLKAGGTGLNLTAADHVFLMDPWWNPAVEDQASDRAYRIGQDKPVMVYRVVAADTVEEKILKLQEAKRALAQAALGEAEASAAMGLGREELLELLT